MGKRNRLKLGIVVLLVAVIAAVAPAHADDPLECSPPWGNPCTDPGLIQTWACATMPAQAPWQPCTDPNNAKVWLENEQAALVQQAAATFYATLAQVENTPVCPLGSAECQSLGDTIDNEITAALDQTEVLIEPAVEAVFGPPNEPTYSFWGSLWHAVRHCLEWGAPAAAAGAAYGGAAGAVTGGVGACAGAILQDVFH